MNLKISVIIPVYKVEKYLDRCIQSVLRQRYEFWEMILVDDGSPDSCPQICDEYALKYPNIHVIHQENQGLSDARNAGLRLVKGDLLIFLDSDDWLSDDAFTEIIARFPDDADMLFLDYTECYENSMRKSLKKVYQRESINFSADSKYSKDLLERTINEIYSESSTNAKMGFAWNAVFRVGFIRQNGLAFPKGTCLAEDKAFTLNCISCSDRIYYHSVSIYNYLIRQGTLSHMTYDEKADFVMSVLEKLYQYVSNIKCDDASFHKRLLNHYRYVLIITLLWRSAGTRDGDLKRKSRRYCRQSAQEVHQSGVKDFPASAKAIMFLCRHNRFAVLEWMISTYRRVQYSTLWKR